MKETTEQYTLWYMQKEIQVGISNSVVQTKLSPCKASRSASGTLQRVLRQSYKFSIGIKEKGTHLVARSHITVNSNPHF